MIYGCLAQMEMETPQFKKQFLLVFSKRPTGALEKAIEKRFFGRGVEMDCWKELQINLRQMGHLNEMLELLL